MNIAFSIGKKKYTVGNFTFSGIWSKTGRGYFIVTNNITNTIETKFYL